MKSLHPGTHSITYDFQKVSVLYTQYSMFPCWNQQPWIQSQSHSTPPSSIKCQWQPEFEMSEILDSKIDNHCCACKLCILSVGQVMRTLMKKLPDTCFPNSDMLPNSFQTSTQPTQPSLSLCQVSSLKLLVFFILGSHFFMFKHSDFLSTVESSLHPLLVILPVPSRSLPALFLLPVPNLLWCLLTLLLQPWGNQQTAVHYLLKLYYLLPHSLSSSSFHCRSSWLPFNSSASCQIFSSSSSTSKSAGTSQISEGGALQWQHHSTG